jgi:hypothetical protein
VNEAFQSCHFDYRLGVNDNGANTFFNKAMGGGKIMSPTIQIPQILKKRTLWVLARSDVASTFVIRSRVIFRLKGNKIVEFPVEGIGPTASANTSSLTLGVQGLVSFDTYTPDSSQTHLSQNDLLNFIGYNVGTLTTPLPGVAVPHTFMCAADEVAWEVDSLTSGAGNSVFYGIAIRSEEVPA